MPKKILALLFATSTCSLDLHAATRQLRTCVDERPWLPYTSPDPMNPGNMQIALKEVGEKLGIEIINKALPWKRCRSFVKSGMVDAMIGGAYVDSNREFSDFPMLDQFVNNKQALGFASVVLIRRLGSKADFDGKSLTNVTNPIGVAAGTQVMLDEARKFGQIDDGAKTDEQNIQKLLKNRIDLMAAYEYDIKALIEKKYQGKLEILEKPLVSTYYYLAFSKKFTKANREIAEAVWGEIGARKANSKIVIDSPGHPSKKSSEYISVYNKRESCHDIEPVP